MNNKTPYGLDMPKLIHKTLSKDDIKENLMIVGDIHGCYDEFMELLNKSNYDPNKHTLICVGDLVCRGPKSADVVQFMRKNNIYCVRGNVDESSLSRNDDFWNDLDEEDIEYVKELPYSISIPHMNIIIVHAGVMPGIDLRNQDVNTLIRIRHIYEEDKIKKWTKKEDIGIPWQNYWNGPEHIFYGHYARIGLQKNKFSTGLDTGSCFGGELTMCIVPDYKFVQVKCPEYTKYIK